MLSRTADDIFWVARYVERAENLARLLEVADRMSMMPAETDNSQEWQSVLTASGVEPEYRATHAEVTAEAAINFIAFAPENPSSIRNCIRSARENARAQRASITREFWEAINDTWLKVRQIDASEVQSSGLSGFVDTVKQGSHLVRGALAGTMIRDDLMAFLRLGTLFERADSTARILDVKYHVVLPPRKPLGGATDYYHWNALLRSVSAEGSYRRLFSHAVDATHVAELLTLRPEMPRSIRYCYDEIIHQLDSLSLAYGESFESQRMSGRLHSRLKYSTIAEVMREGLHEFLTHVIDENIQVVNQLRIDFHLTPDPKAAAGA